jgi:predicted transcriptional regulator
VAATATVAEALRRMADTDRGRLLVTENGHVTGLITRTGITRFVQLRNDLAVD